jgi:hypothetical protein
VPARGGAAQRPRSGCAACTGFGASVQRAFFLLHSR